MYFVQAIKVAICLLLSILTIQQAKAGSGNISIFCYKKLWLWHGNKKFEPDDLLLNKIS